MRHLKSWSLIPLSLFIAHTSPLNADQQAVTVFNEYNVQKGDSLFQLSQDLLGTCSYHSLLLKWNPELDGSALRAGQVIRYSNQEATAMFSFDATVEKIDLQKSTAGRYACTVAPVASPVLPPPQVSTIENTNEANINLDSAGAEIDGLVSVGADYRRRI